MPEKAQRAILYGSGDEEIRFTYDESFRSYDVKKPFEGVVPNLERRWRRDRERMVREEIGRYMTATPCNACNGFRLKPEALAVKIAKKHIGEISELSVRAAADWFSTLPEKLNKKQNEIAYRILKEIRERLTFLIDVGSII